MTPELSALLEHGAACVRVAAGDKRPLGNAWQTLATSVADVIDGWLDQGYNLGILLGHGNLIDVEYDDEAGRLALAARGLLDINTPTWASGRGEHRLFRLAGPLPPMGWRKAAVPRSASAGSRLNQCSLPAGTRAGDSISGSSRRSSATRRS